MDSSPSCHLGPADPGKKSQRRGRVSSDKCSLCPAQGATSKGSGGWTNRGAAHPVLSHAVGGARQGLEPAGAPGGVSELSPERRPRQAGAERRARSGVRLGAHLCPQCLGSGSSLSSHQRVLPAGGPSPRRERAGRRGPAGPQGSCANPTRGSRLQNWRRPGCGSVSSGQLRGRAQVRRAVLLARPGRECARDSSPFS